MRRDSEKSPVRLEFIPSCLKMAVAEIENQNIGLGLQKLQQLQAAIDPLHLEFFLIDQSRIEAYLEAMSSAFSDKWDKHYQEIADMAWERMQADMERRVEEEVCRRLAAQQVSIPGGNGSGEAARV
jgi:hypothetical protein